MKRATQVQLALTVAAVLAVLYIRLTVFPLGSPFELFLLLNILLAVLFTTPAALASVLLGYLAAHVVMAIEARFPTRYVTMTVVYLLLSGILVLLNHRWHRAKDRAETQRLAHEKQRERLLAEAQVANKAKDRLLANVSHELRTPLNAISGWALMMSREGTNSDDARRAAQVIRRNAEALANVVDQLLDVSLAVAGQIRIDSAPVAVGRAVAAAVESMLPEAVARGITIHSVVPPDAGTIQGDDQRLQQVLLTVLSNAIKFTGSGGQVRVDARNAGTFVTIEVSDTGVGIPADFLPFVFDRFSQADPSPTRPYGGIGLGMAIAKNLVELMGGHITVASEGSGRGITVSIQFPIHHEAATRTVANA
jgi:signal transduction histidine kinase